MNGLMIRTYGSNGRENLTRLAVTAALLTLTACGGGSSDSDLDLSNLQSIPPAIGAATDGDLLAATDVAELAAGNTVKVSILSNDTIPEGTQLQLVGQPANGTAVLDENGDVSYTANSDFEGTDTVDYILVAADGTQSTGTLYIAVACADCLNSTPAATAQLPLVDSFGNRYCTSENPDSDGDGYGWENNASCVVPAPDVAAALPGLAAKSDSVTLYAGDTTAISALRNDLIADRSNTEFSIDVGPTNGVIKAADGGVIVYTAPSNFEGTDSLVYSLTDTSGNTSVANIDFNVECPLCTTMAALRLSWPANPANENVDGYKVFFGPDENAHTSTMLTQFNASDFSGSAPNAIYDLSNDLNLSGSEGGCFRVTAVRGNEESEPSDPICFTLG